MRFSSSITPYLIWYLTLFYLTTIVIVIFVAVVIPTHPANFPSRGKPEHPEKIQDFRQSVHWLLSHPVDYFIISSSHFLQFSLVFVLIPFPKMAPPPQWPHSLSRVVRTPCAPCTSKHCKFLRRNFPFLLSGKQTDSKKNKTTDTPKIVNII